MHPTQKPDAEVAQTPADTPRPARLADRLGITEVQVELSPADVLRGAARYLQRYGWHQGDNYADDTSPTPPACALGALGMAAYGQRFPYDAHRYPEHHDYNRAEDALRDYLGFYEVHLDRDVEVGAYDDVSIATWNDEAGRTADQVVQALNAAADDWDSRHSGGVR